MKGSFLRSFYTIYIIIIMIVILISCFFTPIIVNGEYLDEEFNITDLEISEAGFLWPTPGYTKINSLFGKRNSPTAGASSYHAGIDINAPENTKLLAVCNGEITYCGFLGGGGYTITLTKDNLKITYCHVSPMYIVSVGDSVIQGQVIGYVGPKYVYGVPRKSIQR